MSEILHHGATLTSRCLLSSTIDFGRIGIQLTLQILGTWVLNILLWLHICQKTLSEDKFFGAIFWIFLSDTVPRILSSECWSYCWSFSRYTITIPTIKNLTLEGAIGLLQLDSLSKPHGSQSAILQRTVGILVILWVIIRVRYLIDTLWQILIL